MCPVSVSLLNIGQPWDEIQDFIDYWLATGAEKVIIRRPLPEEPLRSPLDGWEQCYYLHWWYLVIKSDGRVKLCERNVNSPVIGNAKYENLGDVMKQDCMLPSIKKYS